MNTFFGDNAEIESSDPQGTAEALLDKARTHRRQAEDMLRADTIERSARPRDDGSTYTVTEADVKRVCHFMEHDRGGDF
jgi:hypothetical protein